jgi:hypothetical protein
LEVVVSFWPAALLSKVMVAPGTTAPLGSVTTPRSDVVAIWAKAVAEHRHTNTRAIAQKRLIKKSSRKVTASTPGSGVSIKLKSLMRNLDV